MITSLHRIHTKDKLEFFGVLYLPDGNRPEADLGQRLTSARGWSASGRRVLSGIKQPIFTVIGEKDDYLMAPIEKIFEVIKEKARNSPRVECRMIKGADHDYRGHEKLLASAVLKWLQSF